MFHLTTLTFTLLFRHYRVRVGTMRAEEENHYFHYFHDPRQLNLGWITAVAGGIACGPLARSGLGKRM